MTLPEEHVLSFPSVALTTRGMELLNELGITSISLKNAAIEDHALLESTGGPMYSKAYIDELRNDWITKQEARLMLGMTDHQLWHWLNLSGRKARLIGKVSLIRRVDVSEELRKRASPAFHPGCASWWFRLLAD